MAYKRTTRSSGKTVRHTHTINTNTGKQTHSTSQRFNGVTFTRNSDGESWMTTNQNGWITRVKTSKSLRSNSRKKTKPTTFQQFVWGSALLFVLFVLL